MKKHFILLLIIFAMLILFASCAEENNAVSDTANANTSEDNLNNTVDGTNSSDETSITQIGDFIITTPRGQEAVQNEDGTIILPNGSMYEYSGDKYTALNGIVIDGDGTVNMSLPANIGKELTIEQANGDTVVFDKDGDITVNGISINDMVGDLSGLNSNLSSIINIPWMNYTEGDNVIYKLEDETKIIMPKFDSNDSLVINPSDVTFNQKITIEYINGIIIEAPAKTTIEFKDGTYLITIGNENATIINTDGTEIIIPSGTIINDKGSFDGE